MANKGFVSYWGGSSITYWDGDDWLERGFFDSMFDEDMAGNQITIDRQYSNIAACYSGLTEVTLQGGNEDYYWHATTSTATRRWIPSPVSQSRSLSVHRRLCRRWPMTTSR